MSVDVRLVQRADGPDLVAMNRANSAYHAPWIFPFTDIGAFDAWFGQTIVGPNVGFVSRLAPTRQIVGVFHLSQISLGVFRSAYLSYHGNKDLSGRGHMAASLRICARYAFSELGLHRLEANIQPENHRSIALARRAGFVKEGYSPAYLQIDGVWRDHEHWALIGTG